MTSHSQWKLRQESGFGRIWAVLFIVLGGGLALAAAKVLHLERFLVQPCAVGVATNAPVKVRGGAMTFRSTSAFSQDGDGNPCVPIKSGTQVGIFEPGNSGATADNSYPLQTGVQIDFFGHEENGGANSNDGVRVLITSTCNGSSLGATIVPEPLSHSSFYPFQDQAKDEDKTTYRKRFLDSACIGTPSPSGDEDTCEHLSTVYVNSSATITPKSNPAQEWLCTDGECDVKIGY
jgi:hypothetical protein